MIDTLVGLLAPHICCSCGAQNALLCKDCTFDIIDEPFVQCVGCLRPQARGGVCAECRRDLLVEECWVVGMRTGGLKSLIDQYKFDHAREAAAVLGELLHARVETLPSQTLVMYIPDIATHRRQRGHDHMALVARAFIRSNGLMLSNSLTRVTQRSQRGLGRKERLVNQHDAFAIKGSVDPEQPVLVIDDIYTTGATMRAAVRALRDAGYDHVYCAIIARQPLDQNPDL